MKSTRTCTIEPLEKRQLMAAAAGTGLLGTYFNNSNFTGTNVSRTDAKIYFDFAKTPPPTVKPTTYSARWTGQVKAYYSEPTTFYVKADDGVRLWVNHKLLIDHWVSHTAATEDSGTTTLVAAGKVDIQLEYYNNKNAASVQLWWSSPSQVKSVIPASRLYPAQQNLRSKIDHTFSFAEQQIAQTITDVGNNAAVYPINTKGSGAAGTDGSWAITAGDSWTAGFLGAEMWQAYQHNPKKATRLNATAWTKSLANETGLPDDMGFRIALPYLPLYGISNAAGDKATLVAAADAKLAQWNTTVGMFRSEGGTSLSTNPAGNFAVLLDHSMDMHLLYWASSATGNNTYKDRATAHLLKLAQNYVRSDGSTAQWGYYSSTTGAFVGIEKKQGYSTTSSWSRGQGWAIYAYTDAYAQTTNATFLATARKAADYWIAHVPADGIPYWDFASPDVPNTYKDTSAAAIAASGLLQLAKIDPDATRRATYKAAAEKILNSLTTPGYLAEGSTSHGVLLHGASFVPRKTPTADNSLIYGDYYLLEAMNRYVAG